jgi:hypothetical protein
MPTQLICVPGQVTAQAEPTQSLPSSAQSMPSVPAEPAPGVQRPAAPQKLRLLVGSMQAEPQTTCPDGQAHVEPVQRAPLPTVELQMLPELPMPPAPQPAVAPQCDPSVDGSTQTPPHSICVPGQVTAHAEPTQTLPSSAQLIPSVPAEPAPVVQTPLAPQKVRLLVGSMQAPLHETCPDGHAHVEPVQRAPLPTVELQMLPELPTPPAPQPAVAAQ